MADRNVLSLADVRRRQSYRVWVRPGLWKGFEVAVDPPAHNHPLRSFKEHEDAMAWAEEIARVEGWPISDACDNGPRAA